MRVPAALAQTDNRQYNDTTGEVGGFGSAAGRVQVVQQINHDGEVNRARYMPQNKFIVATKTPAADVLVFDWSRHESKPDSDGISRPNLRLRGHRQEGYGLMWSPQFPGSLLSGSGASAPPLRPNFT